MINPFRHTEPDFSNDPELQGQPDDIRFLRRICKAKGIGDFETVLLEYQKMLYVYGRDHPKNSLCEVGNAWEKLGHIDYAIAYHEEAIEINKSRQQYHASDLPQDIWDEIDKKYDEMIEGIRSKINRLEWLASKFNHTPVRIYIDMDDVLCDYMKAYEQELADNPSNPYPQSREGFYLDLDPIDGAIEAMDWIEKEPKIDPYILTAPSVYNPHSYTEKRLWIEKYLGFDWCNRLVLSPDKSVVQEGIIIDDLIEGHGKDKFKCEIIHFGSADFRNWNIVTKYFKNHIK